MLSFGRHDATVGGRMVYVNSRFGFRLTYANRLQLDPWETDHDFSLHDSYGSIFFYAESAWGQDLETYFTSHIPRTSSTTVVTRENRNFLHIKGILITIKESRGWPDGTITKTFYFSRNGFIFRISSNGPDWNEFENILNSFEFTDPVSTSEHNS